MKSKNSPKSYQKNGFLILFLDFLFVIAFFIYVLIELLKNREILASIIKVLK